MAGQDITREQLAQLLNQVLKGAEYMNIAAQPAAQRICRVNIRRSSPTWLPGRLHRFLLLGRMRRFGASHVRNALARFD
jgi:hypothetical protein